MGLEVLQKSDDPLKLFEGVFQIALGLEKTFVGVLQSSDIDAEAEKVDDALPVIEDFTLTVSHDGEQFHADVEEGQDVGMGPSADRVPVVVHVGW